MTDETKGETPNNQIIDHPNYYALPCGKQLEDFIHERHFSFAFGSALKYYYRAGRKLGESQQKDVSKFMHFCAFLSRKSGIGRDVFINEVKQQYDNALAWDGVETRRSITAKEEAK